jgi:hypothetical protein
LLTLLDGLWGGNNTSLNHLSKDNSQCNGGNCALQRQQQWQRNNDKDASAMRETMPVQRPQQHQCIEGDNASTMTTTMPEQQERQCQRNKGKETCAMTMAPSQQQQWCQCKKVGDDASATMWQCQRNHGNNAVQQLQRRQCIKGKISGTTAAKVPANQWLCCHCNDGKEASAKTVTVPCNNSKEASANLPPPPIEKHDALSSSLHPSPLCLSCRCLARHPPAAITVFLFVVFVAASPTPFSYGWLLCVGWTGSNIIDVVIACQMLLFVIIISPPSPPGAKGGDVQGRKRAWWWLLWHCHSAIAVLRKGGQSKQEDVFMVVIVNNLSENSVFLVKLAKATL